MFQMRLKGSATEWSRLTCQSAGFACRPGDELLAVAGSPYDTLEEVC